MNVSSVGLRAGLNHRTAMSGTLQYASVSQIHRHPDYRMLTHTAVHNVVLLQLAHPGLEFNTHVQPVCLPESNTPSTGGCYTAGWGTLDPEEHSDKSETLQEVAIADLAPERCREKLDDYSSVLDPLPIIDADTMICAGSLDGSISVCLVSHIYSNENCSKITRPKIKIHVQ